VAQEDVSTPVVKVALRTYEDHEPDEKGNCPLCRVEGCEPRRLADELLVKVGHVQYYVVVP
jgi:hypothetical protein